MFIFANGITIADGDFDLNGLGNTPPGDFGAAFLKMILSLALLIALLAVTIWFMRRLIHQKLEKGSGAQSIHVLEKKMLSPKTMLYLVEVEHQKVLIAESHLEVRKVQTLGIIDTVGES